MAFDAPDLNREREALEDQLTERMKALVTAAREMLKSEDDVAPTVPEQRRRWWPWPRRTAPVTPASDAAASA
ncbi:hypothetical protein ACFTWD_01385 [Streptomyces sp. NPDC056943]|uniref:hypothetical protein n=1 Tax=Streptomyces sp. NPDC056943 TaxID=3345971 RepID=UPI003641FAB7